jgi:hypothetical protein
MSYLRYLCLFGYSGVQHILCCVFVSFFLCSRMTSSACSMCDTRRVTFVCKAGGVTINDREYRTMLGTSLPPVICRGTHVLFTLFVFAWL